MSRRIRNLLIILVLAAGAAALIVPRLDLDLIGSAVPCDEITTADEPCDTGDGQPLADALVVAGTIGAVLLLGRLAPGDEAESEAQPVETGS